MTTGPVLVIDNTRPIDPTLPDLYDGIHHDCELPPGAAIAMAVGGLIGRLGGIAFWVTVGLAAGLLL